MERKLKHNIAMIVSSCIARSGQWKGDLQDSKRQLESQSKREMCLWTNPQHGTKSTLIGHTLYLMGGWVHYHISTKVVHKVDCDLNELVTKALSKQATPTLWQTTEDIPHYDSAPLNVRGSLLAVGGRDDRLNPVSSIHLYQPDTRRWVKVGDLPTAQYNCTCSVLPSGEVIVAGGKVRFMYRY